MLKENTEGIFQLNFKDFFFKLKRVEGFEQTFPPNTWKRLIST